jgi:hypothetical protein
MHFGLFKDTVWDREPEDTPVMQQSCTRHMCGPVSQPNKPWDMSAVAALCACADKLLLRIVEVAVKLLVVQLLLMI